MSDNAVDSELLAGDSGSVRLSSSTVGMLFGITSAAAYTAANVCLRNVALVCDPAWVACVRAVPLAVVSVFLVTLQVHRGVRALPPLRLVPALLALAIFTQFGGNVAYQFSLGTVGVAVTSTLTYGTLILVGALLAWLILREPLSRAGWFGLSLTVMAIVLLGSAANEAASSLGHGATETDARLVVVGVLCSFSAGLAYAFCNIFVRRMVTNYTSLSGTLVFFAITGVVVLSVTSLARLGYDALAQTTPEQYAWMIGGGVCNAIAFYSIAKCLQLVSVARVNALNASQLAMVALVGTVLFDEAVTFGLVSGVALTIAGLLVMHRGSAV
ncbi:MAG: DMT family transporter [Planctomycetes bacterium]|nr:DMT family transporter [Planctomycetota bacterium]